MNISSTTTVPPAADLQAGLPSQAAPPSDSREDIEQGECSWLTHKEFNTITKRELDSCKSGDCGSCCTLALSSRLHCLALNLIGVPMRCLGGAFCFFAACVAAPYAIFSDCLGIRICNNRHYTNDLLNFCSMSFLSCAQAALDVLRAPCNCVSPELTYLLCQPEKCDKPLFDKGNQIRMGLSDPRYEGGASYS